MQTNYKILRLLKELKP